MNLPFKISVLVFVRDECGRQLMIRRAKEPNKDMWSPIGGKLEMAEGESPFECAARETREETSLDVSEGDFHLFAMVSERAYEGGKHWLMFLFDCKKRINVLPADIGEGRFGLFEMDEIKSGKLRIPDTDRILLWDAWEKYGESGFVAMRADCLGGVKFHVQEVIAH